HNLMELHLGYNALKIDAAPLNHMKLLRELTFARCLNVLDFFPSICRLDSLEELHITDCELESLPSSIIELENLRVLDVSCNRLQWLPAEIFEIRSLEELNVSSNRIVDIENSMNSARNIYDADFSNNRLE